MKGGDYESFRAKRGLEKMRLAAAAIEVFSSMRGEKIAIQITQGARGERETPPPNSTPTARPPPLSLFQVASLIGKKGVLQFARLPNNSLTS